MFIINVSNEVILKNHFITLNNIIILSIAIFTALIIKEIETGFSFQN